MNERNAKSLLQFYKHTCGLYYNRQNYEKLRCTVITMYFEWRFIIRTFCDIAVHSCWIKVIVTRSLHASFVQLSS